MTCRAVDGEPAEVPKRIRVTTRKIAADNELSKGAFTRSKAKKVRAATAAAPTRRSTRTNVASIERLPHAPRNEIYKTEYKEIDTFTCIR